MKKTEVVTLFGYELHPGDTVCALDIMAHKHIPRKATVTRIGKKYLYVDTNSRKETSFLIEDLLRGCSASTDGFFVLYPTTEYYLGMEEENEMLEALRKKLGDILVDRTMSGDKRAGSQLIRELYQTMTTKSEE